MSDEDKWTAFDDEQVQMEAMGLHHPLTVALEFARELAEEEDNAEWLAQLVTPESRESWGDFTSAKRAYRLINQPGFGSRVNRPKGASDVGYFKILSGVAEGFDVNQAGETMVPAMITLVWRPEAGPADKRGMWLVHGFGVPLDPADLIHVRTSPDNAPDF
jgi:hypothetical protein